MRRYKRGVISTYTGTWIPEVLAARGSTQTWLVRRLNEYERARGSDHVWRVDQVNKIVRGWRPITREFVAAVVHVLALPEPLLFYGADVNELTHAISERTHAAISA